MSDGSSQQDREGVPLVLIDIFVPKNTPLHRVDPRIKIISAALLTVLCFFLSDPVVLLVLLAFMQVLILYTGVSLRTYSSSFWLVARFSILLFILWSFFDQAGSPVLLDLTIYKPTIPAMLRALVVSLRIFVIASGWLILMLSTRQGLLVRGLVKLGCPYDFGISLSIALRYVPNFLGTIAQIKDAQKARGLDTSQGNLIGRARNMMPVLIPTFAIAFRAIEGLSEALLSRGYGANQKRTYYRDIKMRGYDFAILTCIMVATSAALILDLSGKTNL